MVPIDYETLQIEGVHARHVIEGLRARIRTASVRAEGASAGHLATCIAHLTSAELLLAHVVAGLRCADKTPLTHEEQGREAMRRG